MNKVKGFCLGCGKVGEMPRPAGEPMAVELPGWCADQECLEARKRFDTVTREIDVMEKARREQERNIRFIGRPA